MRPTTRSMASSSLRVGRARRALARLCVVAIVALGANGCGGSTGDTDGGGTSGDAVASSEPEFTGGSDGPVIFARAEDGGLAAAMDGVLELKGECLLLAFEHGTDTGTRTGFAALIFPFGATWDGSRATVSLLDGREMEVGQQIELGGGEIDLTGANPYVTDPAASEQLATCGAMADGLGFVVAPYG